MHGGDGVVRYWGFEGTSPAASLAIVVAFIFLLNFLALRAIRPSRSRLVVVRSPGATLATSSSSLSSSSTVSSPIAYSPAPSSSSSSSSSPSSSSSSPPSRSLTSPSRAMRGLLGLDFDDRSLDQRSESLADHDPLMSSLLDEDGMTMGERAAETLAAMPVFTRDQIAVTPNHGGGADHDHRDEEAALDGGGGVGHGNGHGNGSNGSGHGNFDGADNGGGRSRHTFEVGNFTAALNVDVRSAGARLVFRDISFSLTSPSGLRRRPPNGHGGSHNGGAAVASRRRCGGAAAPSFFWAYYFLGSAVNSNARALQLTTEILKHFSGKRVSKVFIQGHKHFVFRHRRCCCWSCCCSCCFCSGL